MKKNIEFLNILIPRVHFVPCLNSHYCLQHSCFLQNKEQNLRRQVFGAINPEKTYFLVVTQGMKNVFTSNIWVYLEGWALPSEKWAWLLSNSWPLLEKWTRCFYFIHSICSTKKNNQLSQWDGSPKTNLLVKGDIATSYSSQNLSVNVPNCKRDQSSQETKKLH